MNTLIKDGNIFKQNYLPFAGEKKNRNSFIDLQAPSAKGSAALNLLHFLSLLQAPAN